jgi:hypothetical protein
MIKAFEGKRFIFTIATNDQTSKIFDVMFSSEGSIYVNFPYFKNSIGIASLVTYPAGKMHLPELSYLEGGKVTSHLVKFAYHPNGRTHFSQTGKVKVSFRNNQFHCLRRLEIYLQSKPKVYQNTRILTL